MRGVGICFSKAVLCCQPWRIYFHAAKSTSALLQITVLLKFSSKGEPELFLCQAREFCLRCADRIAPGLASQFDWPCTVPAIAPRPLLILNGKEDPQIPIEKSMQSKTSSLELPVQRKPLGGFIL